MDLPNTTELLIAVGAAIAAGWRALRHRGVARRALESEVERWARAAARAAWGEVQRRPEADLVLAFAGNLRRLSGLADVVIGPELGRRAVGWALEEWFHRVAYEAGEAAARLQRQIDRVAAQPFGNPLNDGGA